MTIQDWGVTYDDLEPHYDAFEYLCGTSGTAGNLKGQIQEGGNPFEGPRSRPYPNPPQKQGFGHTLLGKAARELGYKPFPQPSGNMSQAYTNPLGVRMGPCTYCGYLRMVRLRQLFQGEPADHDPAGAGPQIEFLRARQFRGHAGSTPTAPASAPPASPSSTPAARNGSSRPIS